MVVIAIFAFAKKHLLVENSVFDSRPGSLNIMGHAHESTNTNSRECNILIESSIFILTFVALTVNLN